MLKKMYAFAVAAFLLALVLVKDDPGFPKSGEIEILNEHLFAAERVDFRGGVEGREYYAVVKGYDINFDDVYTSVYSSALFGIKPDENGKYSVVRVEDADGYGGPDDYRLHDVILAYEVREKDGESYGFVNYFGRLEIIKQVSRIPILKILPGVFIRRIEWTKPRWFVTEDLWILMELNREQVIQLVQDAHISMA